MTYKEQVYEANIRVDLNYSDASILKILDTLYSKDFWKKFKRLSKEDIFHKICRGGNNWIPLTAKHLMALRDINDKLVKKGVPPVVSIMNIVERRPIRNIDNALFMVSVQEHVDDEGDEHEYTQLTALYEVSPGVYGASTLCSGWDIDLPEVFSNGLLSFYDQVAFYELSEMFEENIDHVLELDDGCYIIDKDGVGDAADFESGIDNLDKIVSRSIPYGLKR